MPAGGPNWAEQVTAIATAVGAVSLLGAIGAAIFAAQQVREARTSRQAHVGAEFVRRWGDDGLVEARRLVAEFETAEELARAFRRYLADNSVNAYVLYRELDFFEQLGALERLGAVDFELIELLLAPNLIDRWEMWRPSLEVIREATGREDPYPMFGALVAKMREATRTRPVSK